MCVCGGGAPADGQLGKGGEDEETGQGQRQKKRRGKDTSVQPKFSVQASILARSAAFSLSCIMQR